MQQRALPYGMLSLMRTAHGTRRRVHEARGAAGAAVVGRRVSATSVTDVWLPVCMRVILVPTALT